MNNQYDAIIIGAGIIGAAVGLELSRKGWKTLNIDKLPAAGYGSTSASCAIIRTHYSTLDGTAFAYEGYFYWKDWAAYLGTDDERGLAEFHDRGCMIMKTAANGYLVDLLAHQRAVGIPFEEWDRDKIKARVPHINLDTYAPAKRPEDEGFGQTTGDKIEGAVFFSCAGYVSDPQLSTHNIQRAVEADGGEFQFNAEVIEIRKDSSGRVIGVKLSDQTEIDARVIVNVAGPHSSKINEMAAATSDMGISTRALKQEVVHVPMPIDDWDKNGFVISDSDISCYTRPEKGNFLLVGSEDPECDPREFVDPDDFDENYTEQWNIQAMRAAQRIPALSIPNQARGLVSLYDASDDWLPIYDKSCVPGFYMACGSSGNQFKNAPVAGLMMAELIESVEAGHDHDKKPLKFHMKYTDLDIDVGFYSRLRKINPESSFSVLG
ncbi:MAG: sarcosine oxidase subunit beta [Gammaproteobacteria bacterium]|jgi:sarcosine oxidase subunit beta